MKEATGELNMTVIIVVMVAILVSFFFFTFWPLIRSNVDQTTSCSKAVCPCKKGDPVKTGMCEDCYVVDSDGQKSSTFNCVWKG